MIIGVASACATAGSDDSSGPDAGADTLEDSECISTVEFFRTEIWNPIVSKTCIGCHNHTGLASASRLVLTGSSSPGYIEINLAIFEALAGIEHEGEPWLAAKPAGSVAHGGGEQFSRDSEAYQAFVDLVAMLQDPPECESEPSNSAYFDGLVLLDEARTLRKAAIVMLGRLPTAEEQASVSARAGESNALDEVLDGMMKEDAFYEFVQEAYNDSLLTDRYLERSSALDLLDADDYPDRYWYRSIADNAERRRMRDLSNDAVAREALTLIAYVIRNGLPFTEILTAEYAVLNPFAARSYGITGDFDDENDPNELKPVQLPGIPHAGILTSAMVLNRFPTTPTNRNRHRAKMIFEKFLASDIMALGSRPRDPSASQGPNPTLDDTDCTVCHASIDSVAGLLQNWNERGQYRPPEDGWYADMFHPGFGPAGLPVGESANAARFLGQQIAADPRFAVATVHMMFQALIGREPLREPGDLSDPGYTDDLVAFEAENAFLGNVADRLIASGYNFKVVVKELVSSPYFRAIDIASELSEERTRQLLPLGTPRLLSPEALDRKIRATTGYPWRYRVNQPNYLMSFEQYRILYGGIDSDSVTTRITEPGGIMMGVAARMANDLSCINTPRDFLAPADERSLFPLVELTSVPEDPAGVPFSDSAAAIRANIRYLYERLLGVKLDASDPELERAYDLFVEVWRDGIRGLADGDYEEILPRDCRAVRDFWTNQALPFAQRIQRDPNYVLRSWMAVLSYMLSDYRFLYE